MPQLRRSTPPISNSAGDNNSGSGVKQTNGLRRIGVPLPGLTIPAVKDFDNIHAEGVPTSPQYDQVLQELRQAQGRRFSPRDTEVHCNGNVKPAPASVTSSNPSGSHFPPKTVGQFKKVRFLEDGTGNLHTSVFGESTESLGSILDAHDPDQNDELSFDNVISSLVNYNNPVHQKNNEYNGSIIRRNGPHPQTCNPGSNGSSTGSARSEPNDIRIPSVVLEVLRCTSPEVVEPRGQARVTNQHNCVRNLIATYPGDAVGQETEQSIIHLEPDDPNSVDSGSVLSELDFEETSSTVTSESNKTDSISSPVMKYQSVTTETDCDKTISYSKPDISSDPFAELSDLLERSLQEIRWMEEDTAQKTPKAVVNPVQQESAPVTAKREPLYELIGRKRAAPPQLNIRLSPSSPLPLPRAAEDSSNGVDVWIPRADWTPPPKNSQAPKKADDLWLRRNGAGVTNGARETGARKVAAQDNAIYGRLWESSSSSSSRNAVQRETNNNNSYHNNNNGKPDDKLREVYQQNGSPDEQHDDLTVIRSMARKARFEHWRLAGISPSSPEGADASAKSENANTDSNFHESSFLSSLPLFQIPGTQEGSVASKPPPASTKPPTKAKKLAIELTWPPPPIPPSPCSSSASATPVSPTCPGFPCGNDHSPKCFGHDSHFQWPVLALPNKQVKRSGSFKQETLTDSLGDSRRNPVKRSESLKEKQRPTKPPSLQAAQDWYWIEEFPQGAGIEPGTGNMSMWFHGAISRTEAELRLANQPAGAFLARLTERLWGYALSVKSASAQISHYLIDAADNHTHKKYALLGSCDPPHRSLRELIQFYGKHPLGPESKDKLTFPCPQECAVRCSGSRPAVSK